MIKVLVVDADAQSLAVLLASAARSDGSTIQFRPFISPDPAIAAAKENAPDLVLLHHTWDGLTVRQVLERFANAAPDLRVIVFTGRELNLRELIECVRFGVCDYWQKTGDIDFVAWVRQISAYCDTDGSRMSTLSKSSGSARSLAAGAEAEIGRLEKAHAEQVALKSRVRELESKHYQQSRAAIVRGAEWTLYLLTSAAGLTYLRSVTGRAGRSCSSLPCWCSSSSSRASCRT
ncbi:MAG: hypothetical protein JNL48_17250 [Acidobacteria bacterium]|nr:hypothetical protein [Acidobacteriota bacterium]